jgi:hypothetical protein
MASKINPGADAEFRDLVRQLAVDKPPRKKIARSPLDPDAELFGVDPWEYADDEEDDSNELFVRDYSTPGPGRAQIDPNEEWDFLLTFADKGGGIVDTRAARAVAAATFTRATTATTVLSNGLIGSVASGSARSYYDPTSLAYLGYLAEGARTNLCIRNEAMGDVAWTQTDITVTANNTTAPDGAVTADLITEGSAGTSNTIQNFTGTADANYAVSRFLKFGNTAWVRLVMLNGANEARAWFNIQTGVVGTSSVAGTGAVVAARITAYPSGWYRVELVGSVGSGATDISVQLRSAAADASAVRVNGATRFDWGSQYENNVSFASSYMPTAGVSFTRNADVLTYPFTATSGTLFGQFVMNSAPTTTQFVASATDGSNNNRFQIAAINGNSMRFTVGSGGVVQADLFFGSALVAGAVTKIVGAFTTNSAQAAANAVLGTEDTSVTLPVSTSSLAIGTTFGTGNELFGTISRIGYQRPRRANAYLQTLTT